MINGTQFITSLGVEALDRAENVCNAANAVAALSLEVLKGTTRAFDEGQSILGKQLMMLSDAGSLDLGKLVPCKGNSGFEESTNSRHSIQLP